jgi:microcin C transport system permease protein
VTARLIDGLRVSLSYGLQFFIFCYILGITVGLTQGYFAGRTDFVTERVKELIDVLPFLSVVILITGLMKSDSFWVTLGVVVFLSWSGIASQLRAQVLSVRKREYVEAARSVGAKAPRIIFTHILPNAITPLLTLIPFTVSGGIATLAILDYLGFGLSPPTPSLGELLQEGRVYIQNAVWLLITPTVALSWMLISINLIGESLREAFDPRK